MAFSLGLREFPSYAVYSLRGILSSFQSGFSDILPLEDKRAHDFTELNYRENPYWKKGNRERNRTSPNQWIPSQYSFFPAGNLIEKISHPLTLRQGRFQRGSHIPLSPSTTIIQNHRLFVKTILYLFSFSWSLLLSHTTSYRTSVIPTLNEFSSYPQRLRE